MSRMLLIYLQSKNIAFPSRLQRLLGAKKLPSMNVQWMERLLQGFLYDDVDSYMCDKTYRELLIADLKSSGLIEKKKVVMTKSAAVEKMLTKVSVIWTEMQYFCSEDKSKAMPDMQDYPATGHPIAVHSAPYGFSHM